MTDGATAPALELAWREHWGRLVGLLIGQTARPDLAEDAVADAFAAAARTWPVSGVPTSPGAWLLTAARRRALDVLRTEAVHRRKEPLMVVDAGLRAQAATATDPGAHVADERLRLVFTCCHPALAADARVVLTLRFVVGLDVADIAALLLLQEPTAAARLTRAKKRLAAAGIPFVTPPPERLDERLDVVATVVYLVFTAGYHPGPRDRGLRVDLGDEAIRLARLLDAQLPGRPVVRALLALMLLQHSRRDARTDDAGALVLLPDQDRSRWHHDEVAEAVALLAGLPPATGLAEEYRLQALIAAEHATAARAADTRWTVVAEHYAALEAHTGSPVVRLARAVAVAEAAGPEAGLRLLDGIDDALPHHHRPPAVRGELLLRLGRREEAAQAFA
ncbi:RNA polymerase subunit sigma-24, partial [Actinotalea ferrariae]|uniref:RNA polymerase sigma factor n=1 Tax=Actinotalea ferrariae TaxID=1386098 RepID=UPI001C8CCEA8